MSIMLQLLLCVAMTLAALFSARRLTHIFQLESYQFRGYFKSVARQWKRTILPYAAVGAAMGVAGAAVCGEGVIKPERLRHIRQTVPGDGPIRNLVVDASRVHVVDVLGVIRPVLRLAGADELPRLHDDLPDAPLPHPGILPAAGVDPVHHHARHRLHAVFSLASRLALNEPRQQFPVGIGHIHPSCRCPSLCRMAGF